MSVLYKLKTNPKQNKKPGKRFFLVSAITAVILSVLFLVTAVDTENKLGLTRVFGFVVRPIQEGLYSVTRSVSDYIYDRRDIREYQSTINDLNEKLLLMEQLEDELSETKAENERLKKLLNAAEETYSDRTYLCASVSGRTPGYWLDEFTLDKGSADGVTENMIVVDSEGLIGRVTEVGRTWSRVTTVIDGDSSVAVMLERTRDNGILYGTTGSDRDNGMCLIYYLPFSSAVTSGDVVITSGLGGYFPKGIKVGTILSTGNTDESGNTFCVVKTAADFDHIETVLLISPEPDYLQEGTE